MTNQPKREILNSLIICSSFAGAFSLNIVPALQGPRLGACFSLTFFCVEVALCILRYRLSAAPSNRGSRLPERSRTRRYRR